MPVVFLTKNKISNMLMLRIPVTRLPRPYGHGVELEYMTEQDKKDQFDFFGQPVPATEPAVLRLYKKWQELFGFERKKLTTNRRTKIRARLKVFTEQELTLALETASQDPGTLGHNRLNRPFTDLVNIFRNDERVDMYLDMAERINNTTRLQADDRPAEAEYF